MVIEVFEEVSKSRGKMWHVRRIDTDTMEPTNEEYAIQQEGNSVFEFNFDPDYDRNAAEFPLFAQQNLGHRRREGSPEIKTYFDFIVSQCGADIDTEPEGNDDDRFLAIFLVVVKFVLGSYSFDVGPRNAGVKSLVSELENHFAKEEKWQEMVATFSFLVEQALALKSSLTRTCLMEEMAAVGLEGCGLHSQAAMLYTEAGGHLNTWRHPKASQLYFSAGRAWVRHGDFGVAEHCFAQALQALRLEFDHVNYKASAVNILAGLIEIYANLSPSLAAALHALLKGADLTTRLPSKPEVDGFSLISEFSSCRKSAPFRSALQYIIVEATSVEQLRACIENLIARSGSIAPDQSFVLSQDPDQYDDDDLFRDTAPDECAVCFLPIPHGEGHMTQKVHQLCCGQGKSVKHPILCMSTFLTSPSSSLIDICRGCAFAMCEMRQQQAPCPFCRVTVREEELLDRCRQRAEKNDGDAMYMLGTYYQHGTLGLPRNAAKADKLFERAAELGSNCARIFVGIGYLALKPPREDQARHLLSLATIDGDSYARFSLGKIEYNNGNARRAVMHWMIAAKNGSKDALEYLQKCFKQSVMTKQDLETALRAYHEMRKSMKSEQREAAAAAEY